MKNTEIVPFYNAECTKAIKQWNFQPVCIETNITVIVLECVQRLFFCASVRLVIIHSMMILFCMQRNIFMCWWEPSPEVFCFQFVPSVQFYGISSNHGQTSPWTLGIYNIFQHPNVGTEGGIRLFWWFVLLSWGSVFCTTFVLYI